MPEKIIKGIVISTQNYGDFDQIVKIATSTGIISFIALGTLKPTSKNRTSLNLGTLADFEIFLARQNGKVSKLKKAHLVKELNLDQNFGIQVWQILSKLTLLPNYLPKLFAFLEQALLSLNNQNYQAIIVYLLIQWIRLQGFVTNFNKCYFCGTNQNLVNFDFQKGMQCLKHESNLVHKAIKKEALAIFYWSNFDLSTFLKEINFNYSFICFEIIYNFLIENTYMFN